MNVAEISGVVDFVREQVTLGEGVDADEATIYKINDKAFLIERKNTIEVRTDRKLADHLREKYESVMESRYFGRGGIEIVLSGQLEEDELKDLVRLSFDLTKKD